MKFDAEPEVRKPSAAGTFYPSKKEQLEKILNELFQNTTDILRGNNIKGLIVPHAGYIYSGPTAVEGYSQITPIENQHFVILGPSHSCFFQGIATADFPFWETPMGLVKHRAPTTEPEGFKLYSEPHLEEHCLEVQLPFLQHLYTNFSFTGFLTGQEVDIQKSAKFLLSNYPNSIFIASSDLSHYLPQAQAVKKDQTTIKKIVDLDSDYLLSEENCACGNVGIAILIEIAKLKNWKAKLIKYDTSATASGDKSKVVGYAAIAFYN